MRLSVITDRWEMVSPFVTSREAIRHIDTITVCLEREGFHGRGEALGVDYLGETAGTMREQIESVRAAVEHGEDVTALLPPGGARNALDCALWDLRAKEAGLRAWELLGTPHEPVDTVFTLSLDAPEKMAREAAAHADFQVLKLKLDSAGIAARLRAVRQARPDAGLIIDANGGWSRAVLEEMADELLSCGVGMVEQPLPVGADDELADLNYPVILCADESCQSLTDLRRLSCCYDMVNIKLDKCGGLSEAMEMVAWCRENGIALMVGNMLGSSLAMAPAFVVAQYCRYVDLDGPLWQTGDRSKPLCYDGAVIHPPDPLLWG